MTYPPGTTPKTREDVDTVLVYTHDIGGHPVPRQWFNRLEACAYLGVSPRTLLRLRKEGRLTGYAPEAGYGSDPAGGKLRYRRADLDALLELKPAPHPDAPSEPDQDPIPGLEVVPTWRAALPEIKEYVSPAPGETRNRYLEQGAQALALSVRAGEDGLVRVSVQRAANEPIPDDIRTELGARGLTLTGRKLSEPEFQFTQPEPAFPIPDHYEWAAEDATWD